MITPNYWKGMRKMTDNEIITHNEMIKELNLRIDSFSRETLDLINRQKEKIKEFDEKLVIQQGLIDYQKAEIEKLKQENEFFRKTITENAQRALEVTVEEIEKAKSEAIKEFAERLKEKLQWDVEFDNKLVFESDIDDLVKEMTEVPE